MKAVIVKYARMVVPPQSEAWDNLKLTGTRRKDLNGWLVQAQAMVEAVAQARVQQNLYKGNKQSAKEQRDQEQKALKQWMSKFVKAARFAFDENGQQLEVLGIVVSS